MSFQQQNFSSQNLKQAKPAPISSNYNLFVDTTNFKQYIPFQNLNMCILQDADETISTKSSIDSAEMQDKYFSLSSQQSSAKKIKHAQNDNIIQQDSGFFSDNNSEETQQSLQQFENFQQNFSTPINYQQPILNNNNFNSFSKFNNSQPQFNLQSLNLQPNSICSSSLNFQQKQNAPQYQKDDVRNHINLDFIDEDSENNQSSSQTSQINNQFTFAQSQNSQQKLSSVLYINNINLQVVSLKSIYHIFGNFGNIKHVIYQKQKQNLLIEFQTVLHAVQAKEYLNNKILGGKKIKIFFSHYESLQTKIASLNPENEVCLDGNAFDYRYKEVIDINQINPPSNTIHISNLPPQVFYSDVLQSIFAKAGKIQKIQFYVKNNIRNMCFIKFATVEEGIAAMGLHQYPINNRKIYISFTRVKI